MSTAVSTPSTFDPPPSGPGAPAWAVALLFPPQGQWTEDAGKYRDPDVVFLKPGRISDPRRQPEGADLAVEVVSEDEEDRQRDLVTKRREYARAGIAEYWIVAPKTETILVLVLEGAAYRVHGAFPRGTTATSVLLPTFAVEAAAVFDAGLGRESFGS